MEREGNRETSTIGEIWERRGGREVQQKKKGGKGNLFAPALGWGGRTTVVQEDKEGEKDSVWPRNKEA